MKRLHPRWKRRNPDRHSRVALLAAGALLAAAGLVLADGIPPPLDVACSVPLQDAFGHILPGNNPAAGDLGLAVITGSVVQILRAGANGVPDLPQADGSPGGDDSVFATLRIGDGMPPNIENSGSFSAFFHPPPPTGSKVYARVFDSNTVEAATHWGQSGTFTVNSCCVMDVSILGLWATGQPKGTDPMTTDTDGDGSTDWQELMANTNAEDPGDVFVAMGLEGDGRVTVEGRAHRAYHLLRTTSDLASAAVQWDEVAATAALTTNRTLVLEDPDPPATGHAFYRAAVDAP